MSSITADVLAAQRGETSAFTRLVEHYANMVCAIAVGIVGDPATGEDVGQRVFIDAWTGIGKLRNPASFGAWLRQMTRRPAVDVLRSWGPRSTRCSESPGASCWSATSASP